MKNRFMVFLALSLAFAFVQGVVADVGRNQNVNKLGSSDGVKVVDNGTAYRPDLTGGESASISSFTLASGTDGVADITTISTGGYATVAVPVFFTTSGATCVIHCLRFHSDGSTFTLVGAEEQTVTANDAYTAGGFYWGTREAEFQTYGASFVKIVREAPSGGTVTIGKVKVY